MFPVDRQYQVVNKVFDTLASHAQRRMAISETIGTGTTYSSGKSLEA
jgi:hypothetical protein